DFGGARLKAGEGRSLVVGPPASPNFPWVLLDSMLVRYAAMLERAHGRRDRARLDAVDGVSRVRDLAGGRRTMLQKWFNTCLKGKPDRGLEPGVFEVLLESLDAAGESDETGLSR
ncbi:MAG: hypothetical protein RLZ97_2173, partial [Verrucomicrobiota bacterium]